MLDALKVANFYSGKAADAVRYGQRAHRAAGPGSLQNPPAFYVDGAARPAPGTQCDFVFAVGNGALLCLRRDDQSGPEPHDLSGLELPLLCRFHGAAGLRRFLRDNGADVRNIEDEYPGVGLFQRFLVMNDPTVGRFLVRDCDARLSKPEADLVRQWIDSGRPFHVVRDHVLHNELMIGCLWAGRTDCGIDIVELMRRYFTFGPTAKYGHDQRMLGLMLWPLIRSHCLVHDKYYRLDGVDTHTAARPEQPFRRRPSEYQKRAGRGRAAGNSARALACCG